LNFSLATRSNFSLITAVCFDFFQMTVHFRAKKKRQKPLRTPFLRLLVFSF
jgi:hypothetical protein